jgi:hypothetical protein
MNGTYSRAVGPQDKAAGRGARSADNLFFENHHSLGNGDVLFSRSARDVAERRVIHGRRQLSERDFALSEAIGRSAAEQRRFRGQRVIDGVLGMVGHSHRRGRVADDRGSLAESGGGTEKAKKRESDDSGFH